MKKLNISVIILTLTMILGLAVGLSSMNTQAAAYNARKNAAVVKSGEWVQNKKGYRYQYRPGKYYKNCWKKINGKSYYFDKKGYMADGWVFYKKSFYYTSEVKGSLNGTLQTGFKNLGGKRYYLSTSTGAMFTGWHTIKGKRYYFDKASDNLGAMVKNRWVGEYYLSGSGVMMKNCYIKNGDCYVDEKGKRIAKKPEVIPPQTAPVIPPSGSGSNGNVQQYSSYIFVGDSRTVGMQAAAGGNAVYIAKVGEGYAWLKSKALPKLKKTLNVNPYVNVVFNLGVNDCGGENVNNYISLYRELMADYPKTRFYMESVNPIKDKTAKKAGYKVMNKSVAEFNAKLKAAFPEIYVDTYSYLMLDGFGTPDGIHYDEATYQKIYNYILQNTSK